MINQFDHRANSVRVNPESTHNPYLSEEVSETQHADPGFLPRTQYWVPATNVEATVPSSRGWSFGFRDIARPTDVRTMIASVLPMAGCGHTLPVLLPSKEHVDGASTALLLANFNSFGFDYVTRQKVQATHLTWYTIEQLPVIAGDELRPAVRQHDRPRASPGTTSSGSPTPPTTWPRSPATSATLARRSPGTRRSAGTCGPGSTPSTSTSTAWTGRTPAT